MLCVIRLSDILCVCCIELNIMSCSLVFFLFQAEDGIRDLVRSRGLGDVYKRQYSTLLISMSLSQRWNASIVRHVPERERVTSEWVTCLLYTSDAADERSSVDLGGRRIIKKKTRHSVVIQRHYIIATIRYSYH